MGLELLRGFTGKDGRACELVLLRNGASSWIWPS